MPPAAGPCSRGPALPPHRPSPRAGRSQSSSRPVRRPQRQTRSDCPCPVFRAGSAAGRTPPPLPTGRRRRRTGWSERRFPPRCEADCASHQCAAASRHRRDESAGPEPPCRYRRTQCAEQADALHGQRSETPGQHPQCGPSGPHSEAVLRKAQRQPQPERHQRTVQHGPASGQPQQERAPLPQGRPHCRPRPERTVHPLLPSVSCIVRKDTCMKNPRFPAGIFLQYHAVLFCFPRLLRIL